MKTVGTTALAALGALGLSLTAPASAQDTESENQLKDTPSAFGIGTGGTSWHAEVEKTERGFKIGNPDAEASLIEWISYTCGHCASYERESQGAMDLILLAPGHVSVEVRPVIRNVIDLTISMLVQCGGEEDFKDRHRMYLGQQSTWMAKLQSAPASQKASWGSGSKAARISLASALDFDDMLANQGVSRVEITACLSDDAAAQNLLQNGAADKAEFAVTGTPSFALDGELLTDVHTWGALSPVIEERFKPQKKSQ